MGKDKRTGINYLFILIIFFSITTGFIWTENGQSKNEKLAELRKKTKIRTGKAVYSSREKVIVYFQGLPGNRYDLITIVPESNPDTLVDIKKFTRRLKRGSFNFGTFKPGLYQVRVYFNWNEDTDSDVQVRRSFMVKYNSRKGIRRKNQLLDH